MREALGSIPNKCQTYQQQKHISTIRSNSMIQFGSMSFEFVLGKVQMHSTQYVSRIYFFFSIFKNWSVSHMSIKNWWQIIFPLCVMVFVQYIRLCKYWVRRDASVVKSTRITLTEDFQRGLNSDVRVPRQFLKESLWLKHDIVQGRATGKLLKIQEITSHPATCKRSQLNAMSYLKKQTWK